MPVLFDTHCHLNLDAFKDDVSSVIARAVKCGVEFIIVPGIDIRTSILAVDLAEKYEHVYAAVGIHPSESREATDQTYTELKGLAKSNKVVAIGEIGLDFYHEKNPSEVVQINALNHQLDIAGELALPVILHSRNALPKLLAVLENHHRRFPTQTGSLHAFEGTVDDARTAIQLGYYVGIGGPVTYQNANDKHALAKFVPLENILLETDAPFLAPSHHRQERNEPLYIPLIAERIATLKQVSTEDVTRQTTLNATHLFLRRESV